MPLVNQNAIDNLDTLDFAMFEDGQALKVANKKTTAPLKDTDFTGTDLQDAAQRIVGNRWLNSDEINEFIKRLCKQPSDVCTIHSGLVDRLRHDTRIPGYRDQAKCIEKFRNARVILLPINIDNGHWYLGYILKSTQPDYDYEIGCADSTNSSIKDPALSNRVFSTAENVLRRVYPTEEVTIVRKTHHIPQDDSGSECGVAVLYLAERLAHKLSLDIYKDKDRNCDYSAYRQHILQMLKLDEAAIICVQNESPQPPKELISKKRKVEAAASAQPKTWTAYFKSLVSWGAGNQPSADTADVQARSRRKLV